MSCLVCHEQRPLVGVACVECLEALKPAFAITPEQVRMRGGPPTTSVLVDSWGRTHALRRRTVVGRVLDEDGLEILDATISRQHAVLELREDTWYVRDFGSSNGTFVEGQRLEAETPLRDAERVRFGAVELFFLDEIAAPPDVDTNALGGFTVRDPLRGAEPTQPLPQLIEIELREPTGGGGGVAVIDGRAVQLTVPQFELVALLYQRAQSGKSAFVPASELVHTLSLDSAEPSEDHIRQLVRRLRRVLFKAGISGLVESRYGSGYRLALLRS